MKNTMYIEKWRNVDTVHKEGYFILYNDKTRFA